MNSNPINTEQHLLAALARGERDATTQVYNQHYKTISSWIIKNGGSASDAADIFQEAMVVLFEKAQAAEFRLACKIGTYLFAVSKHMWYKKIEKQAHQPMHLPENIGIAEGKDWVYEDDVNAHIERETHYAQLNNALEQLGEPCSSLLKAFYHKDKSMQEIAADFGYTNPDNAKTQKYKCLARLRKLFYGVQAK